jgi:hypothetical protein
MGDVMLPDDGEILPASSPERLRFTEDAWENITPAELEARWRRFVANHRRKLYALLVELDREYEGVRQHWVRHKSVPSRYNPLGGRQHMATNPKGYADYVRCTKCLKEVEFGEEVNCFTCGSPLCRDCAWRFIETSQKKRAIYFCDSCVRG